MPPCTQILKHLYETRDSVPLSGLLSNVQVSISKYIKVLILRRPIKHFY